MLYNSANKIKCVLQMKSLTTYNLISWFTLDIILVCVHPTLCWFAKSFSFRIHTSLYQPTYHHLKNPRQRCSKDNFWIYRQWFILILPPVLYLFWAVSHLPLNDFLALANIDMAQIAGVCLGCLVYREDEKSKQSSQLPAVQIPPKCWRWIVCT